MNRLIGTVVDDATAEALNRYSAERAEEREAERYERERETRRERSAMKKFPEALHRKLTRFCFEQSRIYGSLPEYYQAWQDVMAAFDAAGIVIEVTSGEHCGRHVHELTWDGSGEFLPRRLVRGSIDIGDGRELYVYLT